MKKLVLLVLVSGLSFAADAPKTAPFVFGRTAKSCQLENGKMELLEKSSWEDCTYAILEAASVMEKGKLECEAKLNPKKEEKKPAKVEKK